MKGNISIEWFIEDDMTLTREQESRLYEEGAKRASDMISEGYTSGELCYEDDELSVRGWWSKN